MLSRQCRTGKYVVPATGSAFTYDPQQYPEGLADAVLRLAQDPMLRSRLVEAGRHTAETYDVELMADAYEERFMEQAGLRN